MSAPAPRHVDLRSLQIGRELGSGAQGTVHELLDEPSRVVKLYDPRLGVDPRGLEELWRARHRMPAADAALVDRATGWPEALVMDGARCCGFTMARIPDRFTVTTSVGPMLMRLQQALHLDRAARFSIPLPDARARLELALSYCRIVAAAHRAGVGLGDISQRNLVWALAADGVDVFALDLDSAAVVGAPRALAAVETPDWFDSGAAPGSLEADRYKLALLVFRTAHAEPKAVPGPGDQRLAATRAGWTPELGTLVRAGLHGRLHERPSAAQWCEALERALQGRSTPSAAPPPGPGPRPALPVAVRTGPTTTPTLPGGARPRLPVGSRPALARPAPAAPPRAGSRPPRGRVPVVVPRARPTATSRRWWDQPWASRAAAASIGALMFVTALATLR